MGALDDLGEEQFAMESAATAYRCEECGYKWNVRGMKEESEEEEDTVSYDADEDVEPTSCPLCGCSDILTQ